MLHDPPYILGLTGSIGMGKTEAAKNFAAQGAVIFDADLVVHDFYAPGGKLIAPICALFPNVSTPEGGINRRALSAALSDDPEKLKLLEDVVHPALVLELEDFLHRARAQKTELVVLNIPLLFEAGLDAYCDGVAVVSAPEDIQRARVLARPGMNVEKFRFMLSRQMSDTEKRRRADFLIDSSGTLDCSRQQVISLMSELRARF